MARPAAILVSLSALAAVGWLVSPARSQRAPVRATSTVVEGVMLRGSYRQSSTGAIREPGFILRNTTGELRTVELFSLVSLGVAERRSLPIVGARRIELAPRRTRELSVSYRGRPLQFGAGLPHHRFTLRIVVHGRKASALASTAYVCRIPIRGDAF
jgi:hypothetical protein